MFYDFKTVHSRNGTVWVGLELTREERDKNSSMDGSGYEGKSRGY